jgi:hypothetical protein
VERLAQREASVLGVASSLLSMSFPCTSTRRDESMSIPSVLGPWLLPMVSPRAVMRSK